MHLAPHCRLLPCRALAVAELIIRLSAARPVCHHKWIPHTVRASVPHFPDEETISVACHAVAELAHMIPMKSQGSFRRPACSRQTLGNAWKVYSHYSSVVVVCAPFSVPPPTVVLWRRLARPRGHSPRLAAACLARSLLPTLTSLDPGHSR